MNSSAPQILFPYDFSPQASLAINQAYHLAKLNQSELTLLFVIDEELKGARKPVNEKEYEQEMREKLDEIGSNITKTQQIKVSSVIARGKVYEKILEVADMINAKFIMMGTKGEEGLKKTFIGYYAMQVVKRAKCPVITIRGKAIHNKYKNIVLPIDLSKESREKVNNAIEIAKLYEGSIYVVSVIFTHDERAVNLKSYQDQVKTFIKKAGVPCSTEIVKAEKGEETIAEAIIKYAQKINGDLIMITTQQGIEIMPLYIGSTAQHIIIHSEIPVMSIVPSIKTNVGFSPY